ncbi:MAG: hypothetical protein QOG12_279, partial [Verrucomicrobiota bacterium]
MLREYWECGKALVRFRGYEPQPVTPKTFIRWLHQYPDPVDRGYLLSLLRNVKYIGR